MPGVEEMIGPGKVAAMFVAPSLTNSSAWEKGTGNENRGQARFLLAKT